MPAGFARAMMKIIDPYQFREPKRPFDQSKWMLKISQTIKEIQSDKNRCFLFQRHQGIHGLLISYLTTIKEQIEKENWEALADSCKQLYNRNGIDISLRQTVIGPLADHAFQLNIQPSVNAECHL